MIKVHGLYKSFNKQVVLRDINLEVREGEILVILGQSGSGKSVFLQHLIGLMKPDRGKIEINGKDITRMSEPELLKLRRTMGYLFQEGALYDFMTVKENVAFPLAEHTRLSPKEIDAKVMEVLQHVGLEEAVGKYPSELSGGMKKRAALARSVVMDSKILFCDEPTSGLDPIKSREVTDLLQGIARRLKSTTVVASHDIKNSQRIADRLVLIDRGEIAVQATPQEFRKSGNDLVNEFLN